MKTFKDSTFKRFTKKELIDYIRMLERNLEVKEEQVSFQYKNFKEIVESMERRNK